jgi:multisubunit Na+/H+ antiporter MnhE subunit
MDMRQQKLLDRAVGAGSLALLSAVVGLALRIALRDSDLWLTVMWFALILVLLCVALVGAALVRAVEALRPKQ